MSHVHMPSQRARSECDLSARILAFLPSRRPPSWRSPLVALLLLTPALLPGRSFASSSLRRFRFAGGRLQRRREDGVASRAPRRRRWTGGTPARPIVLAAHAGALRGGDPRGGGPARAASRLMLAFGREAGRAPRVRPRSVRRPCRARRSLPARGAAAGCGLHTPTRALLRGEDRDAGESLEHLDVLLDSSV